MTFYLVRLANVEGKDVQPPEAEGTQGGWIFETTESNVRYRLLTSMEFSDLTEQIIQDDPYHYTSYVVCGVIEETELSEEKLFSALLEAVMKAADDHSIARQFREQYLAAEVKPE